VREVIRNFVADFDLELALSGSTSAAGLTPDAVMRIA
jgi:hypothetical protein